MRYTGHVKNGVIVLDGNAPIPEGTVVAVEAVAKPEAPVGKGPPYQPFAERYAEFIGIFKDLPEDFALNHDHYIHGTPKKYPSE